MEASIPAPPGTWLEKSLAKQSWLCIQVCWNLRGEGQRAHPQKSDVSPWSGVPHRALHSLTPTSSSPGVLPQAPAFLLLLCVLHVPCPSQSLPSFLSCPPHLTPRISSPAQTAMEVEGAREDEEQRGKRLSDFYDIHQEIGRYGAHRGSVSGGQESLGLGLGGCGEPGLQRCLNPSLSLCHHPGVPSPT